jgi:hypothetical protein
MKKAGMFRVVPFRMFLLVVFILLGLSHASLADQEFNLYGVAESFLWKEFDAGKQVVKESGPLFGLGLAYSREFENSITFTPKGEVFFGSVDYDGQACSTDPITLTSICQPATSTVDYFGIKLDGDIGRRFRKAQTSFIEPFGGFGLWAWQRDIKNGTAADGSATTGYIEHWSTLYFRLGVRGGMDLSKGSKMFAEAGVKLPVYNENTAYVSDIGYGPDVTLHPGKQASFFAEMGTKLNRFKASIFYEGLRFSQSSTVSNGFYQFYQPQSTMDVFGIRIGAVF